jgi:hypothetical protein
MHTPRRPPSRWTFEDFLKRHPSRERLSKQEWKELLTDFAWLRGLPTTAESLSRDALTIKDFEFRGGARRYHPRPARDSLHVARGGSDKEEVGRWQDDLGRFEQIAEADAVRIRPRESLDKLRLLLPTDPELVRPYREWLHALAATVGYVFVTERVPEWPAEQIVGPEGLRPGARLKKPVRVVVKVPLAPGLILGRGSVSTSRGGESTHGKRRGRELKREYLMLPPNHPATGEGETASASYLRLILDLYREEPPSAEDINQRRERWNRRELAVL